MIKAIIIVGLLYVVIGYVVEYINAKGRDDEFKFDMALFKRAIKWPKTVFGG